MTSVGSGLGSDVGGGILGDDTLAALSLLEIEEVGGELGRRIGVALRAIGEQRADDGLPGARLGTADARSPRWLVASLCAGFELASQTLAAAAATTEPLREAPGRLDRHPALVAAVAYGAPTVAALLQRLEQDRRLLGSLARGLESRLGEVHATPWGERPLRSLVTEVAISEAARRAMELERRAALAKAADA